MVTHSGPARVLCAAFFDALRDITGGRGRFASLVGITMLGVMLLVGIRATAANMRNAADAAFRAAAHYDLVLQNPDGTTAADVQYLLEKPYVRYAVAAHRRDFYVYMDGTQSPGAAFQFVDAPDMPIVRGLRIFCITENINHTRIIDGRLPAAAYEVAVSQRFFREARLTLGDTIAPSAGREPTTLAHAELVVVGVVRSPFFITRDLGASDLGIGSVRYYAYVLPDAFISETTLIFISLHSTQAMHRASTAYNTALIQYAADIVPPAGVIFRRGHGGMFDAYFQDSQRLDQIARVFPMLFFLVAGLVALNAANRIAHDSRTNIGVYKALGVPGFILAARFISYAFFAALLGGVLGIALGSAVIPRIIFGAYDTLYIMPPTNHPIPAAWAAAAFFAMLTLVMGAACAALLRLLRLEPGALLRPAALPHGKRVLLERVGFVWRRLGFIGKLTARNLIRYKQRFFMSLIGIMGAGALVLVAFGLSDSIGSVARQQYDNIFLFDFEVAFVPSAARTIQQAADDIMLLRREGGLAFTDSGQAAAQVFSADFDAFDGFINFEHPGRFFRGSTFAPPAAPGAVITERLSRVIDVGVGDSLHFQTLTGQIVPITIAGIVENFLDHFIYMSPEYFTQAFGTAHVPNHALGLGDLPQALFADDAVVRITHTAAIRAEVQSHTDALNVVTYVILVLSLGLMFVVALNLTEINILERTREIATIKVLGFYDTETVMYILRENIILTAIGVPLGLVAGVFLNGYILGTVEIDILKFPRIIDISSFVLAGGLSVIFGIGINLLFAPRIVGIDMVSSLKSVE